MLSEKLINSFTPVPLSDMYVWSSLKNSRHFHQVSAELSIYQNTVGMYSLCERIQVWLVDV